MFRINNFAKNRTSRLRLIYYPDFTSIYTVVLHWRGFGLKYSQIYNMQQVYILDRGQPKLYGSDGGAASTYRDGRRLPTMDHPRAASNGPYLPYSGCCPPGW
jgi:hypothetical protein